MIDREATIDRLWEASGHGTRREDIVAAFEAGEAAARAEPDWPTLLNQCPEAEFVAFFEDSPSMRYVADIADDVPLSHPAPRP